jgi:hypothetical protein
MGLDPRLATSHLLCTYCSSYLELYELLCSTLTKREGADDVLTGESTCPSRETE